MSPDNARERSTWSEQTAAQIRAERAALQLTQEEFSALTGISRSTLIRLERGTRVADTTQMARISEAVGISMIEFVRRIDSRIAALGGDQPSS